MVTYQISDVFFGDFFTDSTMINHHQATVWENMFWNFQAFDHLIQISEIPPKRPEIYLRDWKWVTRSGWLK